MAGRKTENGGEGYSYDTEYLKEIDQKRRKDVAAAKARSGEQSDLSSTSRRA